MAKHEGAAEYAVYTLKGLFKRGTGAASVVKVDAGSGVTVVNEYEFEDLSGIEFVSRANQAAAFARMSRSCCRRRISFRRRRSSSRSAEVRVRVPSSRSACLNARRPEAISLEVTRHTLLNIKTSAKYHGLCLNHLFHKPLILRMLFAMAR